MVDVKKKKFNIFWKDLQFTQWAKFKNRNRSVSVVQACMAEFTIDIQRLHVHDSK